VLALGWVAVTGLVARGQLRQATTEARQLRAQLAAGDLAAAQSSATALATHARRAHQLTTGPAWSIAAAVPGAGGPLKVVRGLTLSLDDLGQHVLPQLVGTSQRLDPASLRRPDGSVDLARIAQASSTLDAANERVRAAAAAVAGLPHSWLAPVDAARTDALAQLNSVAATVSSASVAAHVLPAMLGADRTQRYFVAFQNESEARGTGGLPGAFAILQAQRGKLSFLRFESDQAIGHHSADVDFGPAYQQLYAGAGTTTMYGNSNLSPHFPYAAQIWLSMWQQASGQRLDGAIAVDPSTLGYLLAVTGPATLPDGSELTGGNIVELAQSTVYAKFPAGVADNPQRRQYLLQVAKAASAKILDVHADTAALLRALGKAAGQRRVLVWSADPAIQARLAPSAISGTIPVTSAPYVGLSVVNDGGNKLDYYLDRTLVWTRTGCGAIRTVQVAVTLTNNAPASGLSSYVTGRSDRHAYPVKPGDNRLEVSYLATGGALLRSVNVDGRPGTAGIGTEHGHPVYTVDLELPRGTARTILLTLTEPPGTGTPVVLRQPLVRPLDVRIADASCH